MMTKVIAAALAACCLLAPAGAKPLFDDDAPVRVEIRAAFSDLVRQSERMTPDFDASLAVAGEAEPYAVSLSARGKSRRRKENCTFPPLRLDFVDRVERDGLFEGQKRLKLVTHCRENLRYDQFVLKEYAVYRLYNRMTPLSHRVRLADVVYIDSVTGKEAAARVGFLIEDTDDVARRNGLQEIEVSAIARGRLDPESAARFALFQMMIGNLDWSFLSGPEGDACCHNAKLVGAGDDAPLVTPVPYDFDSTGFVDAPYAAPAEALGIRNIRTRRYRGLCEHNDEVLAIAARMATNKPAYLGVVEAIGALETATRRDATAYLDQFFTLIGDPKRFDREVLKKCR